VRTLHKFFPGLHEILGFYGFNLSSNVVCFNVSELTLFLQNIKYLVYAKIFHEAKLEAFVKMQMTRNQPETSQNRRIFQDLNNVTL